MKHRLSDGFWFALAVAAAGVGCSSNEDSQPSATGGVANAGGLPATGGGTASGGSGGGTQSGGMPGDGGGGGESASAGQSPVGGSGGEPATGGQPPTGGSGGEPMTGGTGGQVPTGGTAGQVATGGTGGAPTSGCGQSGAPTGVQDRNIVVGTDTRTYVLSVPAGYDPNTAMPLVFAWHGLGGSGSLARLYFQVEQRSSGQAIFVYPDGLPLVDFDNQPGWDLTANGIDVQLFDALLSALSAEYCIDASHVFSTGHSYGGFFTNRLGCSRASVLRAIAPVAGGPPWGGTGACSEGVAAWIAHGENDGTVDFAQGEASCELWTANAHCDPTTVATAPSPCVAYEGCDAGMPVHWCVHQDDHNWPSFAAEGIWAFFSAL
jgi:polyhydroxybutyrate depolymerase